MLINTFVSRTSRLSAVSVQGRLIPKQARTHATSELLAVSMEHREVPLHASGVQQLQANLALNLALLAQPP